MESGFEEDVATLERLVGGGELEAENRGEKPVKSNGRCSQEETNYRNMYSLLRRMCNHAPDMIWAKDLECRFLFANQAICDGLLKAKDVDEPIGKTDLFFALRERAARPEDPQWHTFGEICCNSDLVVLESAQPGQFEEFGNVRGKFVCLDVRKAPFFDDAGRLVGTVGCARDITREKETEHALRESEAHSHTILQSMQFGIFIIDAQTHRILEANPKALEMIGGSLESVIGSVCHSFICPAEEGKCPVTDLGQTIDSSERMLLTTRGEKIHILKSVVKTMLRGREVLIESFVDITDRKQAETVQRRNADIQFVLREIADASVLAPTLDELYRTVHNLVGRVFPANAFVINFLDEAAGEIVVPYRSDDANFLMERKRPIGKGMTEYVLRMGRAVHATPVELDRLRETGEYTLTTALQTKLCHYIGAPLIDSKGKTFGVVALATMDELQSFQPEDAKILSIIATQISLTVERRRSEKELVESLVLRERELRRDAQLATRVQNALLAVPEPSDYVQIATIYKPFGYVGGDLYFLDWRYDNTQLRGFLIDAVGHGLSTALHTASLHVLLREVNEMDLPLSDAMRWLNRRASEYFDEATFAGALGFEIDFSTRQLRWVCAGLPKIWIATKTTKGVIAKEGMFLGLQEHETFETNTLPVDVGDAFYFMTDGLTDQLALQTARPLDRFHEMVGLLRTLAESEGCRDDSTAVCIRVRALPQTLFCQDGWPRIIRFNGYGDYQRLKGEIAKILAQLTGKQHSLHEVAVHEALANAMECRDGVPRQHKARLRFNKVGNRLVVRVKTSRIGFAGNAILRRLRSHPEEMFSFGEDASMGRGIPMMLSMSHRMTYNSEGTEVLLAWKL